jgi:hypothetical protein
MPLKPRFPEVFEILGTGGELARIAQRGNLIIERLLQPLLRAGLSEFAILLGKNVSQVTVDVSGIVITDQGVDHAARGQSVRLQPHKKIKGLSCLRSTGWDVSKLNYMAGFPNPAAGLVYDVGHPEDCGKRIAVAVNVAYGHNASDVLPVVLWSLA